MLACVTVRMASRSCKKLTPPASGVPVPGKQDVYKRQGTHSGGDCRVVGKIHHGADGRKKAAHRKGKGDDMVDLDAVSYTHLDVYKRQVLYCGQGR